MNFSKDLLDSIKKGDPARTSSSPRGYSATRTEYMNNSLFNQNDSRVKSRKSVLYLGQELQTLKEQLFSKLNFLDARFRSADGELDYSNINQR